MSTTDATTAAGAIRSLTIRRIETVPIRVPLGRTYRGSYYEMTHRSTIVTRVHTDEGIVGEAYAGDEDAGLLEIDAIIHAEIAPKLIGADALAHRALLGAVARRRPSTSCATGGSASWRRPASTPRCGTRSARRSASRCWRLWGGYRDRLPIISIGGYYDGTETIAEEIAQLREAGMAGMKFKVGGRDPRTDAARFHEARAAAGDDFVLAADANQGWTREDAVTFARAVADADLRWFEEPCRWHNDRRAMRDVRAMGGVPVCAGQSEFSAAGCRDLMVAGAIDVCNFDASWSGGPTEWRRVAGMALTFDVAMAHHEEPQVAAHLLASIANGTYVECFHPDRDPIWWNLIANRPKLEDGELVLPTGPGLGWELDEDYIEYHRVARP